MAIIGAGSAVLLHRAGTADQSNVDDRAASIDQRIAAWQPTAAERRFDEIGWAKDIRDGLRLARETNRPVFVFTHEGRINTGRCGGIAFNLRGPRHILDIRKPTAQLS